MAAETKDTIKAAAWDLSASAPLPGYEGSNVGANIAGAAPLVFFNGTSSEIHIHHADGVIAIGPMKSEPVPREVAAPWLKSQVGQAYVDNFLLKTREATEVDFSSHSDLTPPSTLSVGAATAGNIQATLESRVAEAGAIK